MKVEILGTGCTKCKTLEEMVREIVEELDLDVEITKVTDINKIVEYGVMLTPGLVIDGEVKVTGRLPSKDEIESQLKDATK
ncbi:MAG: thioredoxin family protein [Candidatus Thorarchaeota archaeon]